MTALNQGPNNPSKRVPHVLASFTRRIGRSAALYGALLAAGLAVGLHGSHAAISEVVDWETGDLSQTSGLECPTSSNFSVVTSPVRQGKYAARFHLDSNSGLWGNGWPRCLATRYDSAETAGDEYYYGFSAYIPQKWGSMLWVLHQPASIYNISGCAVAPLAVQAQNGNGLDGLYFRIATGDCSPQMANYATGWPHQEMNIPLPSLDPVPLNTWIDFVIHVKFSETNGTVEVWDRYNGAPYKLELTRTGIPTTQYCSSCGIHNVKLYMEEGLYTPPLASGQSYDLYLDNYIRGGSFNEVAPGGSSTPTQTTTSSTTAGTTTSQSTTTTATTTTATTTTSATTTTVPQQTTTTTTTSPPPTTTTTPTTTATLTTPSGNTVNGKGKGLGNGQGHISSDAQPARTLAAVEVSRPLKPAEKKWIRVVTAAVSVRGAQSVRISLISRHGLHRRLPLLAHSQVGSVDINYWRKTIVTGAQPDGRLALRLRVPRLVLKSGAFALRVRTVGDGTIRTSYLRFTP